MLDFFSINRIAIFDKYTKAIGAKYVYVLSGKLHLIDMSQQFTSYDYTLNGKTVAVRKKWAQKVISMLSEKHDLNNTDIVILAGEKYWEYLQKLLPTAPFLPLANKRIGEQLAWLNARIP